MSANPPERTRKRTRAKSASTIKSTGAELYEIKRGQLAEMLCETFEDGLAVIDPMGRYQFVNDSYRSMHGNLEDVIKIGACYDAVLREGLKRGIWNIHRQTEKSWLSQCAFMPGAERREQTMALSDGRWLMRRLFRHAFGSVLEICVDITAWKTSEESLNEALRCAVAAEQRARRALQAEEVRKHEQGLLSKLNQWLHSCKNISELNSVVLAFITRILPNSTGTLYTYNNSRDMLVPSCSWPAGRTDEEIRPDACWGLRQGRAYHYGREGWRFECEHSKLDPCEAASAHYFCIPILAHGETVGMLHVCPDTSDMTTEADEQRLFILAGKCAEQISLAIANIKLSQELQDQSTKDPLTGLFNRRYFTDRCSREINRVKQTGIPSSLIFLDADNFKSYNDKFGHDAGDAVLKGLSRVLMDHFRENDIVARIGGEEFAVLVCNASLEVAQGRAEALLPKVDAMKIQYGNEILPSISASAGVVEIPERAESYMDIAPAADKALYRAKKNGRNRVEIG
ncbi:MAG: diguanylate cyclase [Filomicrobium sp.]